MSRSMHALVLGAVLGLVGTSAIASNLIQVGKPDRVISVMQNYGVNVPLPQALDTVVPLDWSLHVHSEVPTYNPVSWTIGQDWPAVLETYAQVTGLTVLVSWSDRSVSIQPANYASSERAKQAQLLASAATPLPSHAPNFTTGMNSPTSSGAYHINTEAAPHQAAALIVVEEPVKDVVAVEGISETKAETSIISAEAKSVAVTPSVLTKAKIDNNSLKSAPAVNNKVERMEFSPELNRFVPVAGDSVKEKRIPVTSATSAKTSTAIAKVSDSGVFSEDLSLSSPSKRGKATWNYSWDLAEKGLPQTQAYAIPEVAPKAISGNFDYNKPVAFSKPPLKDVALGIAKKFDMKLLWAAPESNLQGPVTLLGKSATQDVGLLAKALGVYAPLNVEVSEQNRLITIVSKTGYIEPQLLNPIESQIAYNPYPVVPVAPVEPSTHDLKVTKIVKAEQPKAMEVASVAPETLEVATVETTESVSPISFKNLGSHDEVELDISTLEAVTVTPEVATSKAVKVVNKVYLLTIKAGEPLERALTQFAAENGYTLAWNLEGGFDAKREMNLEGKTFASILEQLLPPLKVSADIYTTDSHIIIRPADAVLDR